MKATICYESIIYVDVFTCEINAELKLMLSKISLKDNKVIIR